MSILITTRQPSLPLHALCRTGLRSCSHHLELYFCSPTSAVTRRAVGCTLHSKPHPGRHGVTAVSTVRIVRSTILVQYNPEDAGYHALRILRVRLGACLAGAPSARVESGSRSGGGESSCRYTSSGRRRTQIYCPWGVQEDRLHRFGGFAGVLSSSRSTEMARRNRLGTGYCPSGIHSTAHQSLQCAVGPSHRRPARVRVSPKPDAAFPLC